jgi:hypothetical protein
VKQFVHESEKLHPQSFFCFILKKYTYSHPRVGLGKLRRGLLLAPFDQFAF